MGKKLLKYFGGIIGLIVVLLLLIYLFMPSSLLKTMSSLAVNASSCKAKTILIDGYECHYFDNQLEDKDVLIFVHGFSDDKSCWFPFINPLKKDYRLIAIDLIGHGENKKDNTKNHSFKSQAEFLRNFLDAMHISSPHIIGVSMGGGVVGKYASLFPDQLQSLTLISSAGINGHSNPSDLENYMNQFSSVEEKRKNLPLLPNDLSKESITRFKQFVFHKKLGVPNHLFKQYLKRSVVYREFYLDVMRDFISTESGLFIDELDDDLSNITCPVHVMWGDNDPLLDVSSVEVFQDSLPNLKMVTIIEDCGHATIAEQNLGTRLPMTNFLEQFN